MNTTGLPRFMIIILLLLLHITFTKKLSFQVSVVLASPIMNFNQILLVFIRFPFSIFCQGILLVNIWGQVVISSIQSWLNMCLTFPRRLCITQVCNTNL